jgi:putative hemolysin
MAVNTLKNSETLSGSSFEPIRVGNLTVRLAVTDEEIEAAQALRYRVFYQEMHAKPTAEIGSRERDIDRFDSICDHILVICEDRLDSDGGVVGTYRILRRSVADRHYGFYSTAEYDLAPLLQIDGEIMELGRSCVDPDFRTRPTMQLLWHAIAAYVFEHKIRLMFGCASLPGSDPSKLQLVLSYLYHFHPAPIIHCPHALPERYVKMDWLPKDRIDTRKALAAMPPLIKGYLRLGGVVGDGAVVDEQFNTTDVCVMVKTDLVTEKYFKHYERSAQRPAPG